MFGAKREEDRRLIDEAYFRQRIGRAGIVSRRFPGGIGFTDKDVLDVGSGFGALSTLAALEGARSVVGVDPDPDSVATAERLLARQPPGLRSRVTFRNTGLEDLDAGEFDVAVSMAVFEHVQDPAAALRTLRTRMRPGGCVYLGIGPLYRAPWGDHRRTRAPFQSVFPWAHLVFPESWLVARHNRLEPGEKVSSIRELGLNRARLDDFHAAFESSGFLIQSWRTNVVENRLVAGLLNAGIRIPLVRDLLAVNLYVVLKNPIERRS